MASPKVHLVLVGGLAGSGKTHVAYEVCRKTKFGYLDKDTLVGRMTDKLLVAMDGPYGNEERDSELYLDEIRPMEYECLIASAVENISLGNSTVVSAPFVREMVDAHWRMNIKHDCEAALGRTVLVDYVWVHAEEEVLKRRITQRRAARDKYKLAHWDEWYAASRSARPLQPCFELNCSTDHETEYRAMEIIDRFALLGPSGYVER